MEMKGEQLVPAPQREVWDALNDPEVLKACVPGCEAIDKAGENEYVVTMVARVGPVSAKFKGRLLLSDIKPPQSYSLTFEGQGGAAGFAKGGANVQLSSLDDKTRLAYDVKASVGGKLAQIGSRLVDAAAKKVADEFFRNFIRTVGGPVDDSEATVVMKMPAEDEDATVVLTPQPKKKDKHGDEHHAAPIPRDPDLPDVSDTTLGFFAAGSLVVFVVTLIVLAH